MDNSILRLPQVIEMTGLSRASIYAYKKKNLFPENVQLGKRAVGWRKHEVMEWIDNRQPVTINKEAVENEKVPNTTDA